MRRLWVHTVGHRAVRSLGERKVNSGAVCLKGAAEVLKVPQRNADKKHVDSLETLTSLARAWSMQPTYLQDWPDVDIALETLFPVILIGNAMAPRAHGKRLKMNAEGINFLRLSKRVSTLFPTTGGPFATETVSYLAHDPHYPEGPVWLCLGELRGYCDAVTAHDILGISLKTQSDRT